MTFGFVLFKEEQTFCGGELSVMKLPRLCLLFLNSRPQAKYGRGMVGECGLQIVQP
jgi:hypothetical protein